VKNKELNISPSKKVFGDAEKSLQYLKFKNSPYHDHMLPP